MILKIILCVSLLISVKASAISAQSDISQEDRATFLQGIFDSIDVTDISNLTDIEVLTNMIHLTYLANLTEMINVIDLINLREFLNVTQLSSQNELNLIDVINQTFAEQGKELSPTVTAVVGFLAARKLNLTSDTSNIRTTPSRILETILGGALSTTQPSITEPKSRESTEPITTTPSIIPSSTARNSNITSTTVQTTTARFPTEASSTITVTSGTEPPAHIPDGSVIDALPAEVLPGTKSHPTGSNVANENPIIKQLEEPIEPPSGQGEQGSLPLVLGAAIVVIFVVGVAGATISAKCRRRKLAAKETLSNGSSTDSTVELGIDNPVFNGTDKNSEELSAAFESVPTHRHLPSDMTYVHAAMPLD